MQDLVEGVAGEIGVFEVNFGFDDFDDVFLPIAYYEQRQAMATEALQHHARLSPQLRAVVDATEWTYPRYIAALGRLRAFDSRRRSTRRCAALYRPRRAKRPILDHRQSIQPARVVPGAARSGDPAALALTACRSACKSSRARTRTTSSPKPPRA